MSSSNSFKQRALYKEFGLFELDNKINLTDFLYKNPFYGKINKSGIPISPKTDLLRPLFDNPEVLVLDFVAEAYYGFVNTYFLDLKEKFGIKNFNSKLSNFESQKGWQSVEELYYDHQNALFENFLFLMSESATFRKKSCNYMKTLPSYWWMLGKALDSSIPVTKAGFIKSKFCPPNISGLVIELFDETNFGDEAYIFNNFIKDPLFEAYVKRAASFGFTVDRNAPWRIVARLDSPQMQYYMSLHNTSWNTVFRDYYEDTISTDYQQFKANTVNFYNTFASNYPIETYPAKINKQKYIKNSVQLASRERNIVALDSYEDLDDMYWLEKYYDYRMKENGVFLDSKELKQQTRKIFKAFNSEGYDQAFYTMQFKCGMCKLDPEAFPHIRSVMFYNGKFDKDMLAYSLREKESYSQIRNKFKKSKYKKKIVKMNKKNKTSSSKTKSTVFVPIQPKTIPKISPAPPNSKGPGGFNSY